MKATIKIENAYGINRTHREREEKNGLAHGYKAITIVGHAQTRGRQA